MISKSLWVAVLMSSSFLFFTASSNLALAADKGTKTIKDSKGKFGPSGLNFKGTKAGSDGGKTDPKKSKKKSSKKSSKKDAKPKSKATRTDPKKGIIEPVIYR